MKDAFAETPRNPGRLRTTGAMLLLLVLSLGVAQATLRRALPELGWPDEWIYLTLARNIAEKGSLNTNFYIASSIDLIGYPHRDVHLPGYALALAALGSWRGYTFDTAVALNVGCFAISVLCAFLIARAYFSMGRSFLAAALVALLPPFPGYLAVAYPEHVTAAALLTLVALAVRVRGGSGAFGLGFLLGVSLLFRETLLFSAPLLAFLVGRKRALRAFLPGLFLCLVSVFPPLSAHRAVHPNALYPSAVSEAFKTDTPWKHLGAVITENARINLELLLSSSPLARAEDAVLVFLLGLGLLAGLASFRLPQAERSFVRATLVSTALLFAAMVVIYVVRERGGVWGGVRALMPFGPLFVIGLCGLRIRPWAGGPAAAALVSLSLFLNSWQITFFNRYKSTNLEDQDRAARFIEERTARFAPRRVVGGRYFLYGFRNFPVEVVWSGANDAKSLGRLYAEFPFDFVVIHRSSRMRFDLRQDPKYEWVNAAEGQPAEYQIYRRVEP